MTMGERIKQAIESKAVADGEPYSLSDLGRAVGVSPQTVQQWVSATTTPRRHRIKAIAKTLGCDPVWLETGFAGPSGQPGEIMQNKSVGSTVAAQPTAYERPQKARTVRVPYYPDVPAAAGHGCVPLDEANVAVIEMSRAMLDSCGIAASDAALLQSDGDSMAGVIEHGDLMIIDLSSRKVREGRIFVVSVDNELLVKRVQRIPKGIKLVSDNPVYDPITIMDDDQDTTVRLIGRVAMSWSMTGFM